VSTVRRALERIHGYLFIQGPFLTQYLARLKQVPRVREYREPATKKLLRLVSDDLSIPIGVRTAVLVAYDGLLRVSEYTSSRTDGPDHGASLLCENVIWSVPLQAYTIHITRSKVDRHNAGLHRFSLPRKEDRYCTVRALDAYIAAEPESRRLGSPFFVKRDASNLISFVTPADINRALKKHAQAAGLPVDFISSHSLRIGGAFALANGGVPFENIQQRGRWSAMRFSEMAIMYSRSDRSRQQFMTDVMNIERDDDETVMSIRGVVGPPPGMLPRRW